MSLFRLLENALFVLEKGELPPVTSKTRNFFTDNLLKGKVSPVKGSIVCCDLAFVEEHSGVYVGGGKIVHRDGKGYLAKVTPETFLNRLDGHNNALSVYVSCRGERAVGSAKAAQRALAALSDPAHVGYDLLLRNCHHFSNYCLTGKEPGLRDFSFEALESALEKTYRFDNWRVWDF